MHVDQEPNGQYGLDIRRDRAEYRVYLVASDVLQVIDHGLPKRTCAILDALADEYCLRLIVCVHAKSFDGQRWIVETAPSIADAAKRATSLIPTDRRARGNNSASAQLAEAERKLERDKGAKKPANILGAQYQRDRPHNPVWAWCIPEPNNEEHANAVAAHVGNARIGYLPKCMGDKYAACLAHFYEKFGLRWCSRLDASATTAINLGQKHRHRTLALFNRIRPQHQGK